jgi:beta-lactamase class C
MRPLLFTRLLMLLCSYCLVSIGHAAEPGREQVVASAVTGVIGPLMQQYAIPGMAVALTIDGQNYFYNYGVASLATHQAVTNRTLFEIGSNSKTFTATLAAYAAVNGKLSFADPVSKYLPELKGSSFDHVSLLNLGTHTAGGLPLQVPEAIQDNAQLFDYLQHWLPPYPAGTQRGYSNVSIGLLGLMTARSMQMPFEEAMEKMLFPLLGMRHSYLHVPADQMASYAQGYTKQGAPVRLNPGVLGAEAYGIKTNTADLIRFIAANVGSLRVDDQLRQAIKLTHTGYMDTGVMMQDLIWEQYAAPFTLKQLLAGNSDDMAYHAMPVTAVQPASPAQSAHDDVLINKTGSTNGFASYVAFIPTRKIGIVLLANKNYPIPARVTAAYQILKQLENLQ